MAANDPEYETTRLDTIQYLVLIINTWYCTTRYLPDTTNLPGIIRSRICVQIQNEKNIEVMYTWYHLGVRCIKVYQVCTYFAIPGYSRVIPTINTVVLEYRRTDEYYFTPAGYLGPGYSGTEVPTRLFTVEIPGMENYHPLAIQFVIISRNSFSKIQYDISQSLTHITQ